MYRSEINERSPMRVFERSMHGGLGRGNLGVIAARPGVGKTPMLVQIGLDDLMRERKVLHISREHPVDHVRAYYDEIFHDLAVWNRLEDPEQVRLDIQRGRMIFSHLDRNKKQVSEEGFSGLGRIQETVKFAREVAHFNADVLIIDGFDLMGPGMTAVFHGLHQMAKELGAEVWLSLQAPDDSGDAELMIQLQPIQAHMAVLVSLESVGDEVQLRLLKDHENPDLTDLHLRLDPHSMRVLDEEVRRDSKHPNNPRTFHLHAGGARGAESAFGVCAERWGLLETHYSFQGHRCRERSRGVVELSELELKQGDFSLIYVSRRLGRVLSEIPQIRNILRTIWYQINAANQVFVIGTIQANGTVRGGTGWGAELARLWKKPLYVFDQEKQGWFSWNGTEWKPCDPLPVIDREDFAGTGSQDLTEAGQNAIRDLYQRSFGPPLA